MAGRGTKAVIWAPSGVYHRHLLESHSSPLASKILWSPIFNASLSVRLSRNSHNFDTCKQKKTVNKRLITYTETQNNLTVALEHLRILFLSKESEQTIFKISLYYKYVCGQCTRMSIGKDTTPNFKNIVVAYDHHSLVRAACFIFWNFLPANKHQISKILCIKH